MRLIGYKLRSIFGTTSSNLVSSARLQGEQVKSNSLANIIIIGLLLIWINPGLLAQNLNEGNDSLVIESNIFDTDNPIYCSLEFNIKEFRKDKFKDKKIPAILTYFKTDSDTISKEIHIEARGESRKKICFFPPIKLRLKNTSFDDPYLDQVKNQKLVTHCNSSKDYEEYLLKEYLTYKLFNILTEVSYRVQLMKIDYIDSKDKVKPVTRYAFLIEHTKILAERNDCLQIKSENLGMKHVEKTSMILFSMFQYMIGNVDWSIAGTHNIKLLKSKDFTQELPFVVPYDFDHAGLVNTSYAVNVRDPEIASVRTRVFDGMCYSEEDYAAVIQEFIKHKNDFYREINSFDLLPASTKKDIISYLDNFYKLIDQANFYKRFVLSTCQKTNN